MRNGIVRRTGDDGIEIGQDIRGAQRDDGSIIAYDYKLQAWIDTSPSALRDLNARAGSASNPLSFIPD